MIILAFLFSFPLLKPSIYYLSFLFTLFVYIALSESWNIIGGYAGYLSFGHAAFFGIGAYTTALFLLHFGLSPFYTCFLGGILAAILAAIFGYPCLRLRGPYFAVASLLLGLIMQLMVNNLDFTGGAIGLWIPFLSSDVFIDRMVFYEVMLVLALIIVIIVRWIERSKFGLGLRSIREDEEMTQTLGVNPTKLKMMAFMLSAFLVGIVGGIYAYYRTYLLPHTMFDTFISIIIVTMALLGGSKSWIGPIMGATVLTVINEVLIAFLGIPGEASRIIFGLILMMVVMFMPDGIIFFIRGKRIMKSKREMVSQPKV
jgi:branched-chain amino acid transport system permease protein